MSLFGKGKKQDPVKQAREWKGQLRAQIRVCERQIRDLQREEKKAQQAVRDAAKRGDKASAKILARELVHSRQAKERLFTARAHLNSINLQLQSQIATMRVAGCMQESAEVMKMMNEVVKLPELHQTMMTMGMEMEKAGLIEEMMTDTLEDVLGVEEGEVDAEVAKVFEELAIDLDGKAPVVPQTVQEEEKEPQLSEEDAKLEARLLAL
eukprot:CAMPEP_0201520784 /NCGR_PEP_ID=MMETSP0161_2-20130828/12549_1 /ASSEMBLY_ACC=CAM_ASM_000251 /TAXON_ID=180227 /ORGANISM="Neoparamoeba aestuarina, Strain SoJaBio B1-5/56/2" /LENGTH=208 /DNA_ID=CAMNT_0047919267 /DNA_START=93 /DNA_END=719 /DNA_ORIENTATION=-